MSDLETSFEKLLGRAPTEIEKNRLYRVKDALNLEADDSLWMVLMALDYYLALYETIPKELAGATEPLRELRNAPAIVQALQDSAEATKNAQGLWSTLTARGLGWGLGVGLALGLTIGTLFSVIVARDLWVDYEKWNLGNQITELEQLRATIGANYEGLRRWTERGLVIGTNAIVVKDAGGATAGEATGGGIGIWWKDQ